MPDVASLQTCTMLLCCGLLLYAALHDLAGRTIPNRIAVSLLLIGLLLAINRHTLPASSATAAAVFVAGVLAWRIGMLGGGDVKLLAATTLLVPPMRVPLQLEAVAIAGGLLAAIYLAAGPRLPAPEHIRPAGKLRRAVRVETWRIRRHGPLPYGVAIAAGTISLLASR